MTTQHSPHIRQIDHDLANLFPLATPEQKEAILKILKKTSNDVETILQQEAEYKLLRPVEHTPENLSYSREFLKTFISIGINESEIKSSSDIQEP